MRCHPGGKLIEYSFEAPLFEVQPTRRGHPADAQQCQRPKGHRHHKGEEHAKTSKEPKFLNGRGLNHWERKEPHGISHGREEARHADMANGVLDSLSAAGPGLDLVDELVDEVNHY